MACYFDHDALLILDLHTWLMHGFMIRTTSLESSLLLQEIKRLSIDVICTPQNTPYVLKKLQVYHYDRFR